MMQLLFLAKIWIFFIWCTTNVNGEFCSSDDHNLCEFESCQHYRTSIPSYTDFIDLEKLKDDESYFLKLKVFVLGKHSAHIALASNRCNDSLPFIYKFGLNWGASDLVIVRTVEGEPEFIQQKSGSGILNENTPTLATIEISKDGDVTLSAEDKKIVMLNQMRILQAKYLSFAGRDTSVSYFFNCHEDAQNFVHLPFTKQVCKTKESKSEDNDSNTTERQEIIITNLIKFV